MRYDNAVVKNGCTSGAIPGASALPGIYGEDIALMNSRLKTSVRYLVWLIDTALIFAAFQLSSYLRYGNRHTDLHRLQANQLLIYYILFTIVWNFILDRNSDFLNRRADREIRSLLEFHIWMFGTSMAYLYLAHLPYEVSRLLVARFFLFSFLFMTLAHFILKKVVKKVASGELYVTKVFIIAERDLMESTIRRIRSMQDIQVDIVGAAYASDEDAGIREEVLSVPVAKGMRNLTELMTSAPFDEVFINTPYISQRSMKDLIRSFEEMGVTCHYSIELPDMGAVSRVGSFADYSVITYQKTLISPMKLTVKRIIDIIGGIVGLLITAVLFLFIAPAIKLDSRGPVFFSQVRVGKNGRRFRIHKFRSMYADAEERKAELEKDNEMTGLMFKMENDPRITRVGRFLRETSLDEFPQFLNVLVGDMSLVGTRPPTEEEFAQYDEHYRRRISMTPGLTGLWQVSGRSEIKDFDEVVRLDLEYIDHWSLRLDMKIILRTIGVLFTRKGAS